MAQLAAKSCRGTAIPKACLWAETLVLGDAQICSAALQMMDTSKDTTGKEVLQLLDAQGEPPCRVSPSLQACFYVIIG